MLSGSFFCFILFLYYVLHIFPAFNSFRLFYSKSLQKTSSCTNKRRFSSPFASHRTVQLEKTPKVFSRRFHLRLRRLRRPTQRPIYIIGVVSYHSVAVDLLNPRTARLYSGPPIGLWLN